MKKLSTLIFFVLLSCGSYLAAHNPVVLLGPPLVGKGTLAKKLAAELSVPHISAGGLLRAEVREASELGERIKGMLERGELVPDAWVSEVVVKRLSQADCKQGYILDGYPRRVGQAEALEAFVGRTQPLFLVQLEAPEEVLVDRGSSRLSCQDCGASYSSASNKPKLEGECDTCHGALAVRHDDQPDTIRHRFEVYKSDTTPVLEFYQARRPVFTIDAQLSPEQVFSEAVKLLKTS